MTNKDIIKIARKQSAIDANCSVADFSLQENKVVISNINPNARKYLELPFFCNLISYGNNIVASVDESIKQFTKEYIDKYSIEHCFETPNMHVLNDELQKVGMRICFMSEYFLPDLNMLTPISCEYEMKILKPEDFSGLYKPEWSNALCEKRKSLDVLGVWAFDNDKLIGLAGCSADCESMWQIGVDVLPEHRRKGVATALTNRLACETLNLGKVPFYCTAWSNIKSVKNAIKSGFRPSWVEMTAKSYEFIDGMNK